jgi:hypothetical protein
MCLQVFGYKIIYPVGANDLVLFITKQAGQVFVAKSDFAIRR